MYKYVTTVSSLILLLIACSVPKKWNLNERVGGLGPNEKFIEAEIDPASNSGDPFALYYFTTNQFDRTKPTVLFCAGGPGVVVRPRGPHTRNVLDDLAESPLSYNIVYFNFRGSGLSQFPPNSSFDRYIRTRYAVADIERIRQDLGINTWDMIIGHSYGTVLAQRYAHLHEDKVKRLVLLAPLSRHGSAEIAKTRGEKIIEVQINTLRKIYESDKKHIGLTKDEIDQIVNEMERILRKLNDMYGSVEFIIDNYDQLKSDLMERRLYYPFRFFRALRELRNSGWLSWPGPRVQQQEAIAIVIAQELLSSKPSRLKEYLTIRQQAYQHWESVIGEERSLKVEAAIRELDGLDQTGQTAMRTYYLVSIYDGLNGRILNDLKRGEASDLKDVIGRSAGEAHVEKGVNPSIEKVGISYEMIEAWDPAKFSHSVPTLILRGGADPVTAGGQTDYVYTNGLVGPRILIQVSGLGHDLSVFPHIMLTANLEDPTGLCTSGGSIIAKPVPCLVGSFLQQSFDDFALFSAKLVSARPHYQDHRNSVLLKSASGVAKPVPADAELPVRIFICDKAGVECSVLDGLN